MQNTNIINGYLDYLDDFDERGLQEYYLNFENHLLELKLKGKIDSFAKKLIDRHKQNLKKSEDFLKENGFNPKSIKADAERGIKTVWRDMNTNLDYKKMAKDAFERAKKFFKEMTVKKAAILVGSIGVAILATAVVYHLNTSIYFYLERFYEIHLRAFVPGTKASLLICAVIIGPFIEEVFKRIMMILKIPYVGTTIFAGIEGYAYVQRMIGGIFGLGLIGATTPTIAIATRAVGLLFHNLTTFIQKYFYDKDKTGEIRGGKWIGFVVAYLVHALNNLQALLRGGVVGV